MKFKGKTKFSVGDIVRVISEYWYDHELPKNRIVEITEITSIAGSPCYIYRPNPGSNLYFDDDDLEHCRVADTAIARKLYKNRIYKIEGNWIYLNER